MASNVKQVEEDTQVTILFADVVGSTHLYEALGDDRARETVQRCVDCMKHCTDEYGGSVIKTVGDEVMSTFPSADDALNAASQMQQRITNSDEISSKETRVAIRIGCHFGPVVVENRDIFGAAVNMANRMTSQAKAGQIITTETTVGQLSGEWRSMVRQIDVATVRGQSTEVAVFEVLWQPEEATSMLPSIHVGKAPETSKSTASLHLRFRDEKIVIGEGALVAITLGRADENDIVIKGKLISRIHARIEIQKNKFLLVDESTNGTFVQRDDGEELFVRRDTSELVESGVISLGRVASRGTPLAVEFEVKD